MHDQLNMYKWLQAIAVIGSGLIVASCGPEQWPAVNSTVQAAPECPPASSSDHYFSEGFLGTAPVVDGALRAVASSVLKSAGEFALSCGIVANDAYRLTWIHAFNSSQPIVVRISTHHNEWTISSVAFDRLDSLVPIAKTDEVLQNSEGRQLVSMLNDSGFWTIQSPVSVQGAVDGGTWIIEARRGFQYRVVVRWADSDEAIRSVGMQFVRLAKLPVSDLM